MARPFVGEEGKITGLDFTDAMLEKARENLVKTGFTNIDFVKGDIENMPLPDQTFDVVISNCVLNLIPDKEKAFHEIYRVLKTEGHFCISDVVLEGSLPVELKEAAEMYAGCVSGAVKKSDYLATIEEQGFSDITIHMEKQISIPNEILANYLSIETIEAAKQGEFGIFSITVNATKPL